VAQQAGELGPGGREARGEGRPCGGEAGQAPAPSRRARGARHVGERRVAAEQLVAAEAGEHYLETGLVRRAADGEGVETVDRRLVHGGERGRPEAGEVLPGHAVLDMAGAQPARHLGGERHLVARRAGEDVEAEREGRRRLWQVAAGEGGDQPGIEPGRQEDGDRHVGDEMRHHRRLDGRLRSERRGRHAGGFHGRQPGGLLRRCAGKGGEGTGLGGASILDDEAVAGRQGADGAADGPGLGHRPPEEEPGQPCRIDRARDRAPCLERLDLRGEAQLAAGGGAG
jgi:hypothetical protein